MPEREQVQLGDRVVELPPEDAATVREAFTALSNAYGQTLDQQRRALLEQMGTPRWGQPTAPTAGGAVPAEVEVPDVDLLFQDKTAWANHFAENLESRLKVQEAHAAALVQGAVAAVDQEFKRRELREQAQTLHDETMEAMLERRGLDAHRNLVQAVYNDRYKALEHLPLAMAIDQIGQEAAAEIARIRGGEASVPAEPGPATSPAPPALLRSARRATSGAAAAATEPPKTLSALIRARQAQALGQHAA